MCAHRLKKMVTLVRREAAGGSRPASNGEVSTHRAPSLVARLTELVLWIVAAQRAPQRTHGGRWGGSGSVSHWQSCKILTTVEKGTHGGQFSKLCMRQEKRQHA
jgi:hypothetical protein